MRIFLSFLFTIVLVNCFSQSLVGGDLTVVKSAGAGLAYTARACLVLKANSNFSKQFVKMDWGDGSPIDSLQYSHSSCAYDNFMSVYFQGTHVYQAGSYTLSVNSIEKLVPGINNIPNSGQLSLNFRRIIDLSYYNDPPQISGCIADSVKCEDTYMSDYLSAPIVQGGIGDSLSYHVILNSDLPGYSLPPIGLVPTPSSSVVSFTANASGKYNIHYRIDEWRKSTLNGPYDIRIGSTFREIFVNACNITDKIGIDELWPNQNMYSVMPNPHRESFIVQSALSQEGQKIELINALGETVYTSMLYQNETEISTQGLCAGVYFLLIRQGANSFSTKIVKE